VKSQCSSSAQVLPMAWGSTLPTLAAAWAIVRATAASGYQHEMPRDERPTAPAEVSDETTWFDRAADRTAHMVARPPFFIASLAIVVVWAVGGPLLDFSHRWVDSLQVVVALVTFLIVALLQNEGWRGNKSAQRKLNAIAAALAELMERSDIDQEHVRQLNAAVGLEKRESSSR
jgi:low affinity Fe/Cu permease